MPAAVVFILFVICLIIAIPVSIALTIASVLPGAFDPSFTASGQFVIRSMLEELTAFRSLRFRCSYFPESSWQEAAFPKNYLMYFPIFLEI